MKLKSKSNRPLFIGLKNMLVMNGIIFFKSHKYIGHGISGKKPSYQNCQTITKVPCKYRYLKHKENNYQNNLHDHNFNVMLKAKY